MCISIFRKKKINLFLLLYFPRITNVFPLYNNRAHHFIIIMMMIDVRSSSKIKYTVKLNIYLNKNKKKEIYYYYYYSNNK